MKREAVATGIPASRGEIAKALNGGWHRPAAPTSLPPRPPPATAVAHLKGAQDAFETAALYIDELIAENARLTGEVASLKQRLLTKLDNMREDLT